MRKVLLALIFFFGLLSFTIKASEDYFGVTIDESALSDRQKSCLCTAACTKESWNCAVVSCYYDPSNECNEYYSGECYCGGFGCGRAKISVLSGGDMLDCLLTQEEPPVEIDNYNKQINQLMSGILIYLEKGNQQEAQTALRRLLNVVNDKIDYRLNSRSDIDDATKSRIRAKINDLIANVRFQQPGKGSKIDSCGFLFMNDCLYLDPITSQDIIAHEFSHIIAEELTPGYEIPGGDSSHDFFGYSSSLERSYDEALATLLAVDLLGDGKYSSVETGLDVNYNIIKTGALAENEYEYDFQRQELTEFSNSDSENPQLYDSNNINWYGFSGEAKKKIEAKLSNIELDLELARKNNDLEQVTKLTTQKHKYLRYLNPPVHSPKSEVAVASLLWDLTGSKVQSERLGRIKQAIDAYYNKFGEPPKTEKEFLQGFLIGKDPTSSDVTEAYGIITGERHQRRYSLEELMK
ncbi:MAG TPA: hypothetical protein PKU95_02680 [Candidatus Dojkabacteria bacterium]|nr:hypothetical protein [Candidatus Dojkabacteria bacterium]